MAQSFESFHWLYSEVKTMAKCISNLFIRTHSILHSLSNLVKLTLSKMCIKYLRFKIGYLIVGIYVSKGDFKKQT